MCRALLHDWTNDGYVDVLLTCRESDFSSLASWSCSERSRYGID